MRYLIRGLSANLICLAIGAVTTAVEQGDAAADDTAVNERQPLVTVGPDTTVLTEPLDDEGYVDYQAHANAVTSEGVTPENNAAVLLWQAYGPANIDEEA